jgi:hypothetical protein
VASIASLVVFASMTGKDEATQQWLKAFIAQLDGVAGTVHRVSADDPDQLELAASLNIPEKVLAVTAKIPRGKGMAGLALERDRPVATCNLSTDETGDVRPGAKAVDAQGAVALPVHDDSGAVRAVVGIAYMGEREFTESELEMLAKEASSVL